MIKTKQTVGVVYTNPQGTEQDEWLYINPLAGEYHSRGVIYRSDMVALDLGHASTITVNAPELIAALRKAIGEE